MTIEQTGGPAFPTDGAAGGKGFQSGASLWHFPGMTLLDHFAGEAMKPLIAEAVRSGNPKAMSTIGPVAYALARDMIKARNLE